MLKRFDTWLSVALLVLASRLISMALLPFADTTEPRYAEITRLMLTTGDWVTPWFEPAVPFWGKPPLSFWAQAAAGALFGVSEFSLRLPSWLASIGIIALTWCYAQQLWGRAAAGWSAIILATMALPYVSAGAVMTDSWLTLGTTLSLVSFGMVMEGKRGTWRWLLFLGLAIGLLAKGPVALVLCGLPIALWLGWHGERWRLMRVLPWVAGIALTAILTVPWYLAAELRTPGFLNYFLIGEHFLRFVDAGWNGDLYGSAHDEPKGMIWVFWLMAAFPWSVIALFALARHIANYWDNIQVASLLKQPRAQLVLLSALSPLFFFTMAGNILWTYVLPALPFSAMLLGRWLTAASPTPHLFLLARYALIPFIPVLLTVMPFAVALDLLEIKTEKNLVNRYEEMQQPDDSPLLYLSKTPFSARFYSSGIAREVTLEELQQMRAMHAYRRYFLAMSIRSIDSYVDALPPFIVGTENARYRLVSFSDDAYSETSDF